MRPNIAKVELLKDVTSNEDLVARLLVHDINIVVREVADRKFKGSDSEEELTKEQVLKAETSLYFEAPTAPSPEHKEEPPEVSKQAREGSPLGVSCSQLSLLDHLVFM